MQSVIAKTDESHPGRRLGNTKWWVITSRVPNGKKIRRFEKYRFAADHLSNELKSYGLICSIKRCLIDCLVYDSETKVHLLISEKLSPRMVSGVVFHWFTTVDPDCGIILWPHGKRYPAEWTIVVPDETEFVGGEA